MGRAGSTNRGGDNLFRLPKRSTGDHPLAGLDPDQVPSARRVRRAAAAKERRRARRAGGGGDGGG